MPCINMPIYKQVNKINKGLTNNSEEIYVSFFIIENIILYNGKETIGK